MNLLLTSLFLFDILSTVKKITLQVVIRMTKTIALDNTKSATLKSNKLDQIVELSLLYDFYGALLKDHQREIYEDYILNDLSLSEIASDQEISRQGVYDIVKRCSKQLLEYENKLKLIEKFNNTKERVNNIHLIAKQIKNDGDITKINEIEKLSYQILDEF